MDGCGRRASRHVSRLLWRSRIVLKTVRANVARITRSEFYEVFGTDFLERAVVVVVRGRFKRKLQNIDNASRIVTGSHCDSFARPLDFGQSTYVYEFETDVRSDTLHVVGSSEFFRERRAFHLPDFNVCARASRKPLVNGTAGWKQRALDGHRSLLNTCVHTVIYVNVYPKRSPGYSTSTSTKGKRREKNSTPYNTYVYDISCSSSTERAAALNVTWSARFAYATRIIIKIIMRSLTAS